MVEFVLVHGTTQSPAGWDRLAGALKAAGHGVTAIDLAVDRPEWAVADYAREAAAQAGQPASRRVAVPDLADQHSMAEDVKAHRDAMFHPDWLGADPVSNLHQATRFLFHDCDPPTQQWGLGTLRLFNPGPAVYRHSPQPLPSALACSFILPAGDRTLRPAWMRQIVRQRLSVQPIEINAGHCPHVSQPETIASILVRA